MKTSEKTKSEKSKKSRSFKTTKTYQKWKHVVKLAEQFPVDAKYERLLDLHRSRRSRSLHSGNGSASKIRKAANFDINVRAEAVEIMMQTRKARDMLESANEALRDYLIDKGFVNGRTVAERKSAANGITARGVKMEARLDSFLDIISDLISDCDQAQWQIKNSLHALEIASRPERVL